MKYIFFDIDGTLIDSGGAGSIALSLAFEELFSVRNAFRDISMAGKTDPQILKEGLRLHGIRNTNGVMPEFFRVYVRNLADRIDRRKGHIKPGIREALEVLCSDRTHMLGLLTGNIEEGARIKLEAFGLGSYFATGAFGSDHEDRNRLLPIALERLHREHGITADCRDCVVIGDTPRDIECSKPYGAIAIAVATGPYSSGSLAAAGADIVFENLSDTPGFLSVLRNGTQGNDQAQ